MTRRRLLLALVVLAVLVAADGVWWAALPRPGISEANCARITRGMRKGEVEAILGGPPGSYIAGKLVEEKPGYRRVGCWQTDDGWVVVLFRDGRTVDKDCSFWHQPTFWEQVRSCFRP